MTAVTRIISSLVLMTNSVSAGKLSQFVAALGLTDLNV